MSLERKVRNQKWFNNLVAQRDGWKCKKCGSKHGLMAHHITPKGKLPKHGNSLYNGIMLCVNCRKLAREGKDECYYPGVLYALIGSSKEKAIEDLKPSALKNFHNKSPKD